MVIFIEVPQLAKQASQINNALFFNILQVLNLSIFSIVPYYFYKGWVLCEKIFFLFTPTFRMNERVFLSNRFIHSTEMYENNNNDMGADRNDLGKFIFLL